MHELFIDVPGISMLRLQEDRIDEIIQLMNKEGWYYYDYHDLKRYLDLDQDCFVLIKEDCVVGSIFTTNYGNQAWIGNVVVAREDRGMGLASKMIREVTDYLSQRKNISTFRLGSVPLAIGVYKKAGFHAEAFTTAQQAALPIQMKYEEINLSKNMRIEKIEDHDLNAIAEIDSLFFGSNRSQFLVNIYNDSSRESCLCLKDEGRVVGYLMSRRRKASKAKAGFSEGPDYAYRIGPSCVLPEYGINGFKSLFQVAVKNINKEACQLGGSANIYVVFPKNADKEEIYTDTRELAKAMDIDIASDMDSVFDEHNHIFGAPSSAKNEELWKYMESAGFRQEYFEQVMSYTPGEAANTKPALRKAKATQSNPEGIYASATPGDKA